MKQRKLFYHQLNYPLTAPQKEHSRLSKSGLLGSFKNTEAETLKILNMYPRY